MGEQHQVDRRRAISALLITVVGSVVTLVAWAWPESRDWFVNHHGWYLWVVILVLICVLLWFFIDASDLKRDLHATKGREAQLADDLLLAEQTRDDLASQLATASKTVNDIGLAHIFKRVLTAVRAGSRFRNDGLHGKFKRDGLLHLRRGLMQLNQYEGFDDPELEARFRSTIDRLGQFMDYFQREFDVPEYVTTDPRWKSTYVSVQDHTDERRAIQLLEELVRESDSLIELAAEKDLVAPWTSDGVRRRADGPR
jgi:hypothetical protein